MTKNKKDRPKSLVVSLIVACSMFMENLDSSIINTAIPVISKALNTSPTSMSLAVTSYLLSLAVFLPLSGWLADKFGTKKIFRLAIGLFTLSSIGCGLSQTLTQLVAFRIMQGMGGSMMVPVGRLVLFKSYPKSEFVDAMAWMAIPALIGPVLGPLIGGLIVTYAPWHWIFFVNIPIGVLGIIATSIFIKDIKEPDTEPFDMRGFMLMGFALCGLMFGFQTIGRDTLPGNIVSGLLIVGVTGSFLYIIHFRKSKNPILDFKLFGTTSFRLAIISGSVFRLSVGAMPFLLPMMLQLGFGISPLRSGTITFASSVGAIAMKLAVKSVISSIGFKRILIGNAIISGISILVCAFFNPETPHMIILLILLAGGFFRSLQYTSLNGLAFSDISQRKMSQATTISSVAQQVSICTGIGLSAIIMHFTLLAKNHPQLAPDDFWPAIIFVGILTAVSGLFFIRLPSDAGAEVSGHLQKKALPIEDTEL